MTMAPMSGSRSSRSATSVSSRITVSLSALSAFGRLSRTSATRSRGCSTTSVSWRDSVGVGVEVWLVLRGEGADVGDDRGEVPGSVAPTDVFGVAGRGGGAQLGRHAGLVGGKGGEA